MPETVALVLDPDFGPRLATLQAQYPIWAVRSPENESFWRREREAYSGITVFSAKDLYDRFGNLLGALPDIEDHFGPSTFREDPYQRLLVIGLGLTAEVEELMRPHGFDKFKSVEGGFCAHVVRPQ